MIRTALTAAVLSAIAGAPALAAVIQVWPGQSVQAAVDTAEPGDTILLEPGEHLPFTVARNDIRVVSSAPAVPEWDGGAGSAWGGSNPYNAGALHGLERVAQTGCATSNAVGTAAGAVGTIGSILGASGRATAGLQVAQQFQLMAQRLCQQQMVLNQIRMLTGMDLRTFDDILSALRMVDGMLGQGGLSSAPDAILRELETAYPEAFPEGTGYEAMEKQQIEWNDRVRHTLDTKSQIENQVIANRRQSMQRAGQIEQAGRDSEGLRGAQLATTAMLGEIMGALTDQIAVTTAHQRALTEVQYRQEAERAAAERDTRDFMAPLAEECARCGKIPIDLFGGPNPAGVARSAGRTSNQVFGTGIQ